MNATKLRIGNWACVPGLEPNTFIEVQIVSPHPKVCLMGDPSDELTHFECHTDDLRPIPLTTEWLERFDIQYYQGEWFFATPNMTPYLEQYKGFWSVYAEQCSVVLLAIIQYVHQLQNLYHALTGEELTIKET